MKQIIIQSADTDAFVRIERSESDQLTTYCVAASLCGESVTNDSLVLLPTQEFIRALRKFERSRSEAAVLNGSEDFSLTIAPDGTMGHAWISFQLSRSLSAFSHQSGRGRSGRISLSGSFPIAGEFIGQLVRDLTELLKNEAGNS